jgi:hypothetical protein
MAGLGRSGGGERARERREARRARHEPPPPQSSPRQPSPRRPVMQQHEGRVLVWACARRCRGAGGLTVSYRSSLERTFAGIAAPSRLSVVARQTPSLSPWATGYRSTLTSSTRSNSYRWDRALMRDTAAGRARRGGGMVRWVRRGRGRGRRGGGGVPGAPLWAGGRAGGAPLSNFLPSGSSSSTSKMSSRIWALRGAARAAIAIGPRRWRRRGRRACRGVAGIRYAILQRRADILMLAQWALAGVT